MEEEKTIVVENEDARNRESKGVPRVILAKDGGTTTTTTTTGDPRYHLSSACLPAEQPANAIQFA